MPINATAVANLPNVQCIDKCTPFGRQLAVLIALAAQWGGLSTNPAVLQANASCFTQCIPRGMQMGVLISLAEQITGGGGGGSPTSCSYTPVNSEVQFFIVTQCQVSMGVCRTVSNLPVAKALDVLVTTLKTAGVWPALDALYPFVGGTAASCSLNLVNPSLYPITWHGGVTFPAGGGVTGDGTTGYGDTGFNPTTAGGNYTQNSASIGVVTLSALANFGPLIGACDGSPLSNNASIEVSGVVFGINGAQEQGAVSTANNGLFVATANGAVARSSYVPVNQTHNYNLTISEGLPNANLFLLHTVGASTAQNFSAQTLGMAFFGSGLTAIQIAAVAAAVNTYVNTPGVPGCP